MSAAPCLDCKSSLPHSLLSRACKASVTVFYASCVADGVRTPSQDSGDRRALECSFIAELHMLRILHKLGHYYEQNTESDRKTNNNVTKN